VHFAYFVFVQGQTIDLERQGKHNKKRKRMINEKLLFNYLRWIQGFRHDSELSRRRESQSVSYSRAVQEEKVRLTLVLLGLLNRRFSDSSLVSFPLTSFLSSSSQRVLVTLVCVYFLFGLGRLVEVIVSTLFQMLSFSFLRLSNASRERLLSSSSSQSNCLLDCSSYFTGGGSEVRSDSRGGLSWVRFRVDGFTGQRVVSFSVGMDEGFTKRWVLEVIRTGGFTRVLSIDLLRRRGRSGSGGRGGSFLVIGERVRSVLVGVNSFFTDRRVFEVIDI